MQIAEVYSSKKEHTDVSRAISKHGKMRIKASRGIEVIITPSEHGSKTKMKPLKQQNTCSINQSNLQEFSEIS